MKHLFKLSPLVLALFLFACGSGGDADNADDTGEAENVTSMIEAEPDPMESKGIGPVSAISLEDLNADLATEGEKIFKEKCTACHKPDKKHIGPAPKGILDRRTPEWVMNMILNPEEMVLKDPIARKLLMEFNGSPMANQSLTEDQARAVLEYFRTL